MRPSRIAASHVTRRSEKCSEFSGVSSGARRYVHAPACSCLSHFACLFHTNARLRSQSTQYLTVHVASVARVSPHVGVTNRTGASSGPTGKVVYPSLGESLVRRGSQCERHLGSSSSPSRISRESVYGSTQATSVAIIGTHHWYRRPFRFCLPDTSPQKLPWQVRQGSSLPRVHDASTADLLRDASGRCGRFPVLLRHTKRA